MDNILHDLFYGNLHFYSDDFIQDKDYRAAVNRAARLEDQLLRTLEGQARQDAACLIQDYATITGTLMPAYFSLGFQAGVQLFCASFHSVYSS